MPCAVLGELKVGDDAAIVIRWDEGPATRLTYRKVRVASVGPDGRVTTEDGVDSGGEFGEYGDDIWISAITDEVREGLERGDLIETIEHFARTYRIRSTAELRRVVAAIREIDGGAGGA